MKLLQKVITAADVSSCLYYVHLDCVGEGKDQWEDGEEEGDEQEDGVGNGTRLPLRTQPPEMS